MVKVKLSVCVLPSESGSWSIHVSEMPDLYARTMRARLMWYPIRGDTVTAVINKAQKMIGSWRKAHLLLSLPVLLLVNF